MIFNSDNFDGGTGGSTLAGRVSSGGQTWSGNLDTGHNGAAFLYPTSGASTQVGSRGSLPDSSAFYYLSGDPPSADYGVNFTFIVGNNLIYNSIGPILRLQETAPTATPHFYALYYNGNSRRWEFLKANGTGPVSIGTHSVSYSSGQRLSMTFRVCTSTLELLQNGVSVFTVADTTITGAGHAGLLVPNTNTNFTDSDGWWIDDFEGDSNACNPFPPFSNVMTTVSTFEA